MGVFFVFGARSCTKDARVNHRPARPFAGQWSHGKCMDLRKFKSFAEAGRGLRRAGRGEGAGLHMGGCIRAHHCQRLRHGRHAEFGRGLGQRPAPERLLPFCHPGHMPGLLHRGGFLPRPPARYVCPRIRGLFHAIMLIFVPISNRYLLCTKIII